MIRVSIINFSDAAVDQCTTLLGIVVWGEMEFWLACWKLLCILGGFLAAILINTGAVGGDYIGFRVSFARNLESSMMKPRELPQYLLASASWLY
jgi:amino acid permease